MVFIDSGVREENFYQEMICVLLLTGSTRICKLYGLFKPALGTHADLYYILLLSNSQQHSCVDDGPTGKSV